MLLKLKRFLPILYFFSIAMFAQQSEDYTNSLNSYNTALDLYQNKDYAAANYLFEELENSFSKYSELRANSVYYTTFSAVKLKKIDSDVLIDNFVEQYPTSIKRNKSFVSVANYYYNEGDYANALKWFNNINEQNIYIYNKEDFEFKYGYTLFMTKNYTLAKKRFFNLLNSKKYGLKAKYYYGFMAYKEGDFDNSSKYLTAIEGDYAYKTKVAYYLADISFRTGKFEKAISLATPLLEKSNRIKKSELNKIIGESYFNLNKYKESIPFLIQYKGKRGKWSNTDYYLLGYAYYKEKNYQEAVLRFNKIIDGKNAIAQNAYYHLAECYLNTNKKQEALNAFRNASQMDFSASIKKEAWLNYAKLSYDIGNAYKDVPEVLNDYLKKYPQSSHTEEINSLLVSSFVKVSDYKGALEVLKTKKDADNKNLYQKVSFFRGMQLFNNNEFSKAIEVFNNALDNRNTTYRDKIIYWKAASNYRLGSYYEALKGYMVVNNSFKSKAPLRLNYDIAYTYYKIKKYKKAAYWFNEFLNSNANDTFLLGDATLRLADSYFASSDYKNAISTYQKAIRVYNLDEEYVQYQIAISYGLLGDNNEKIAVLNRFIKQYNNSNLIDDAYYQLANTYLKTNKLNSALKNFNKVVEYANSSVYVPRSLLKEGLIFYNTNSNEKALSIYKKIVTEYPKSIEARQAVNNAKQIYIDIDKVDEFEKWAKSISFVKLSDLEIDNATFKAAEKQYLSNNHKGSIYAFSRYMTKFSNGVHLLQAHFYRAESYYSLKQKNDELENDYLYVINQPQNEFTEQSLWKLSEIYLEKEDYIKAEPLLVRLEKTANNSQNKLFAQSNLMKIYYAKKRYKKASLYAEEILKNKSLQQQMEIDAKITIARSAIQTGDNSKAMLYYKDVQKSATGKNMAEAIYYDAYFKNKDKKYKESNLVIQKLASNYATYKYFGAKGLLLMSKNFNALNDSYQATYILENIIKNFTNYEDIIKEAKIDLKKIKTEASKTNESVKTDDKN